jgi:hypothetical protein
MGQISSGSLSNAWPSCTAAAALRDQSWRRVLNPSFIQRVSEAMWLKQCHFYHSFGNGKHTTYKNGDLGDGKHGIV